MEWLDVHAGSVQSLATLVLVLITAYYAWVSRALVRETRAALLASARTTLQGRLDRIGELLVQQPDLLRGLDDPEATIDEREARFHVANMFFAVFEEAHTQYLLEHAMPEEDWQAWQATIDRLCGRAYLRRLWQQVGPMYSASFRRYLDERLQLPPQA
jgi:hypothetical protein